MIVIHPDVALWVMDGIEGGRYIEGMTSIGDVKDGKLIAGVAFESQNTKTMWGHQRIDSAPSKSFWINVADFIYNQSGCVRFSAFVDANNEKAIKLNKHIGFVVEATLHDAGDNGDVLIMTLFKENCRFLKWIKK
jgi:RimJ/RimL family protein N-acetyltransferase